MARKKSARDRLLDSALRLFSERGYRGATTREIAAAADVNEVTLFRHFGSKEGLFFAVIDREADIQDRAREMIFEPSGDLAGDLESFGGRMLAEMKSKAPFIRLVMTEASGWPEVWEHVSVAPSGVLDLLEDYFRQARRKGLIGNHDPRFLAVTYFSFFFRSMVTTAFLGKDVLWKTDEAAIREHARLFARGISKGK